MRRGKLNRAAYILIIISAIFTIISYASDQMVIRTEDNVRSLNVEYSNLQSDIKGLENLSKTLFDTSIKTQMLISSSLKQRNFWLKNIIFYREAGWDEKRKKNIIHPIDFENNIMNKAYDYFIVTFNQTNIIKSQYGNIIFSDFKVFDELPIYKDNRELENLLRSDLRKIFKNNLKKFNNKNYDHYYNFFYKPSDSKDLSELKIDEWIDINRMAILLIENIYKIDKEFTRIGEDLEKYIDKKYLDVDILLRKRKEMGARKNYFILGSIVSQILTLLFLLILFRKLLKDFKKI